MKNERNDRLRVQRRLIGLPAEDRIVSATLSTHTAGEAEIVEARYLVGAGVGVVHVKTHEAEEAAHALDPSTEASLVAPEKSAAAREKGEWTSQAAYAFHEGSASALRALIEVIGRDS